MHILDALGTALALPLPVSRMPLMSLAVIAAIAVLVYEVRRLFARAATNASLSPATDGPPRRHVPPTPPQAPAARAADRVALVRAEATSFSEPEAPPLVAAPPSAGHAIIAAASREPPRAPIETPPRESAQAQDGNIVRWLALAGALGVGLALLWLVARAVRGRS
jgi:hypothetical protein